MWFILLKKKTLTKLIKQAVDQATHNGFELGKKLAQVDRTNKGIILAGRMNQQINDIIDNIERGKHEETNNYR